MRDLQSLSPRLMVKPKTLPELHDVSTDQQDKGLQEQLVIDGDTVSRLGFDAQTIDDTLYGAFGQRQVSTVFTQLNECHLAMKVASDYQRNPGALTSICARCSNGTEVSLSAFTHFEQRIAPLAVNHQGQYPAVTLSFNLAPNTALGDAVKAVDIAENAIFHTRSTC